MAPNTDSRFTKFEGLLALTVMSITLLATWPYLGRVFDPHSQARTIEGAETIAHAVLDYHTDTGIWPAGSDGMVDLTRLTDTVSGSRSDSRDPLASSESMVATMAGHGGAVGGSRENENPSVPIWLDEVPVDPWERPYRVVVLGELDTWHEVATVAEAASYPSEPPPGVAIVVISAGRNGNWETDLAQLWDTDLSLRMKRNNLNDTPLRGDAFGGDDLGFVLSRVSIGDDR